jgi:glycosyltransferase involved in cell wall biosynthesis
LDISIVLPIYNEGAHLDETVHSLLKNSGLDVELIIVNDGSTDSSIKVIERLLDCEPRIKLINQTNSGITNALIKGCKVAQGKYIARQDAGDVSLPNRLSKQFELMEKIPNAVLCSVGTRYKSERGELISEVLQTKAEANKGLNPSNIDELSGPSHHGATMFRRDAYLKVGGYRTEFKVAQDLDLWLRLAEVGEHITVPEVLYEATLRENSITARKRHLQEIARTAIYQCYQARLQGKNEAPILAQLEASLSSARKTQTSSTQDYNYFVGSVLLDKEPRASRYYLWKAVKLRAWHIKSWLKLLISLLKRS